MLHTWAIGSTSCLKTSNKAIKKSTMILMVGWNQIVQISRTQGGSESSGEKLAGNREDNNIPARTPKLFFNRVKHPG